LNSVPLIFDSGIGRIVFLRRPVKLKDFIEKTKSVLGVKTLRYVGSLDQTIRRVAIINGSGQSYFQQALKEGADCILTGDTTYHHVQELEEQGVAVVDPGHFFSEKLVYFNIMDRLMKEFTSIHDVPYYFTEKEEDPYNFI